MARIENVSDTARWVAVYRAMETRRPDAIFRDPFAERLAGAKGEAIVDTMKRGRGMAWAMIVRTASFDEMIRARVLGGGVDQVVNLAAGLDARPWRMSELPASLRWVDVDLPGILDYKLEAMRDERTVCQYEAVRLDLREISQRQALFAQLASRSQRTLVVSEGLLVYLAPEDVASLATDLHTPPTFHWWLFDIAHPKLLEIMQKMWGRTLSAGNAPFRFAPPENTKFFEPLGWREAEFRSNMEEARRLKREMRGMWIGRLFWRFYSKARQDMYRRFAGAALLERI
jgi:methyltransferase (TIGR00027 family)